VKQIIRGPEEKKIGVTVKVAMDLGKIDILPTTGAHMVNIPDIG